MVDAANSSDLAPSGWAARFSHRIGFLRHGARVPRNAFMAPSSRLQHGDHISLCMYAHETREKPFAAFVFQARVRSLPAPGSWAAALAFARPAYPHRPPPPPPIAKNSLGIDRRRGSARPHRARPVCPTMAPNQLLECACSRWLYGNRVSRENSSQRRGQAAGVKGQVVARLDHLPIVLSFLVHRSGCPSARLRRIMRHRSISPESVPGADAEAIPSSCC